MSATAWCDENPARTLIDVWNFDFINKRLHIKFHKLANESERIEALKLLLSHSAKNRMFDRIRMLFGGAPCLMQAAALPWRMGEHGLEIMLVTSRGTGRWVLPKGWPDRGEELWQTAEREAAEEAGVSGETGREALGSFFYGKDMTGGAQYRCEVHVYPLEVDAVAEKWTDRRRRRRAWHSPEQAAALVREPDLAELIAGFASNPRLIAA